MIVYFKSMLTSLFYVLKILMHVINNLMLYLAAIISIFFILPSEPSVFQIWIHLLNFTFQKPEYTSVFQTVHRGLRAIKFNAICVLIRRSLQAATTGKKIAGHIYIPRT